LRVALVCVVLSAGSASGQQWRTFGPFVVDAADPFAVILDGEIDKGAADTFERVIEVYPAVQVVILNSPGGSLVEAIGVASMVYEHGLDTYIPANAACYSACAYVFLAGEMRLAEGELGVHQFRSTGEVDEYTTQVAVAVIIELLDLFQVAPEVRFLMLTTPPERMHVFSRQEVAAYGIERTDVAVATRPQPSNYRLAVFVGLDFFGADIDMMHLEDAGACAAACLRNSQCRTFTFNTRPTAGPNCFIKSSTGIPDGYEDAVAGVLLAPGESDRLSFSVGVIDPTQDLLFDTDIPGGDMGLGPYRAADIPYECRLACVQSPTCRAFSFVEEARQCWLKSSVSTPVPRPGITSGIKIGVINYTPVDVFPLD